jgi:hypothetical protein
VLDALEVVAWEDMELVVVVLIMRAAGVDRKSLPFAASIIFLRLFTDFLWVPEELSEAPVL